jgi:hypothetical protein
MQAAAAAAVGCNRSATHLFGPHRRAPNPHQLGVPGTGYRQLAGPAGDVDQAVSDTLRPVLQVDGGEPKCWLCTHVAHIPVRTEVGLTVRTLGRWLVEAVGEQELLVRGHLLQRGLGTPRGGLGPR